MTEPAGPPGAAPRLRIEADLGRVNWALERSGVPLVHEIRLRNDDAGPLTGLEVEAVLAGGLSAPFRRTIPAVPAGSTFGIERPDIRLDTEKLRQVLERERCELAVAVRDNGGPVASATFPVDVLAFNEWDAVKVPELLAAFVLPNHPEVATLLREMSTRIAAATGDPSLEGYQKGTRARPRAVLEAAFAAIQSLGISYVNPPASFEATGQKLRFPDQVLGPRMGTCLDLAVLVAAALEQCGLHPVIAVTSNHAFPGVWLIDDHLPVASTDDAATARKLAGVSDMAFVDITSATSRPPVPFAAAAEEAARLLARDAEFRMLLDVRAARLAGILPLPVRGPAPVAAAGASAPPAESAAAGAIAAPAPEAAPPPGAPRATHDRIETWKMRLLDLTLRNRLLNYRPSKDRSIPLDIADLPALENLLASGSDLGLQGRIVLREDDPRIRELLAARGVDRVLAEERAALLASGRVSTPLPEEELDRRLSALARAARTEIEESGSSTLYAALGMLRWTEPGGDGRAFLAPLLLYPVELRRPSLRSRFALRMRDDEPRLNDTLLEKLRSAFGLDFADLRSLPGDDSGLDVARILDVVRRTVARIAGFEVLDEAHVAFFSFTKFLMWRDLDEHRDELLRNDLFRHLVSKSGVPEILGGTFPPPESLDTAAPPATTHLVLDADSSQHAAVRAALDGRTFVLEGPPGTGKSQTIANIIAECLAAGRRVLFVAEKRAALEVVARRLAATGLADWCLELHSSKASRRDVALELARVLETPPASGAAAGDGRLAERLGAEIGTLNGFARALHDRGGQVASPFEAISRLCALEDAPDADAATGDVLGAGTALHESRLEHLEELAAAAADLPALADHALAACRPAAFTPLLAREWEGDLRRLASLGEELISATADARRRRGIDGPPLGLPAIGALADLEALAGREGGVPAGAADLLSRADFPAAATRLDQIAAAAAERRRLLDDLTRRWDDGLFHLDLEALRRDFRLHSASFVLLRWFRLRGPRRQLRGVARGPLPPAATIILDLEHAVKVSGLGKALDGEMPFLAPLLGAAAQGAGTDPATILDLARFARSWRDAAEPLRAAGAGTPLPAAGGDPAAAASAARLREALARFREALDKTIASLRIDARAAFGAEVAGVTPEAVNEAAARWIGALPLMRAWRRFIAAEDAVRDAGLAGFATRLREGRLPAAALRSAFEKAFFRELLHQQIEVRPPLRDFNGRDHDERIRRFRDDDRRFIASGGARIRGKLDPERPGTSGMTAAESEVGQLQREARKKARHLPVRQLLARIPHLLPRLKPCLLMSPLSIAQYLPPGGADFDLVIFDEASQIATHDAVGAIARGKQVIVVGDSRQLPPTTFFEMAADDDEEDVEDPDLVHELESILEECTASRVPSLMLRWHYRSRDERLITFSNWHYYGNRLTTFPAADAASPSLGVSRIAVDGVFDRSKTRTNRAEAEAVAAFIVEALLDPVQRRRSIGVVTFNRPQQDLIEDLLEDARRQHPEIEPFFDDRAPEPVFVKNLENVQGDERDVMLFSVTYGRDAAGRVSMNFGPLNRQGGERRLNVAITRARERLIVFSSLEADDIDLSRTRAVGVEHLRSFLRYAREGPRALAQATTRSGGGPGFGALESDIARALADLDVEVERDVGSSGWRVDLAVSDAERPGRRLLGILCDGTSWGSAATARDRDRLREAVLRNLGWRIHRIWSLDWTQDRDGEIRRLREALRDARTSAAEGGPPGANAAIRLEGDAAGDGAKEEPPPAPAGKPAPGSPAGREAPAPADPAVAAYCPVAVEVIGPPEAFEDRRREGRIRTLIRRVAADEGPVHSDVLFRRMALAFGIPRITARIEEAMRRHLDEAVAAGAATLRGTFVWPPDPRPDALPAPRGPAASGETRDIEHVAVEEAASAALLVLRGSVALPREDLARATGSVFGWKRLTARLQALVDQAVLLLVTRGDAAADEERVRLPR